MSAYCTTDLYRDKMRLFWRARPASLRFLIVPLVVLAVLSFITLSDWVEWSTSTGSRNCVSISVVNSTNDLVSRKTFDWRAASQKAFKRSLNEPSFSGICHNVGLSKADFDTMDIYPTLNFQVGRMLDGCHHLFEA